MSSPTQRTLKKLRDEEWPLVEVTEKWIPATPAGFKGPILRKDLFQFIDVLAIRGDITLGVQTTDGSNVSARFEKIKMLPSVVHWLASPTRKIQIHGWAKRGAIGKVKRWTCRVVHIMLDETGCPIMIERHTS